MRPSDLLVLLAAVASGGFVGPARPAVGTRASVRRVAPARIALCEPAPLVGGIPIQAGDAILCRDPESGAWWRASVRETRGSQVLVHYMGCDDTWDAWLEASSENLVPMDTAERAKEASGAFQSDAYEAGLDDEELLERYREQRWEENARWQLTTFAQAQTAEWGGMLVRYTPQSDGEGNPRMARADESAACECQLDLLSPEAEEVQGRVRIGERLPDEAAELGISCEMGAPSFKPEAGNMAVGNAYTLASPRGDGDGAALLFELGIRHERRRVRAKLLYAADGGARVIRSVGVVREAVGGGAFDEGGGTGIDGEVGRGLYDPPPGDKTAYHTLYCEGGLTLVFPTRVDEGCGGAISLDWTSGEMRYQIDRKFAALDGSLSSLELTEIGREDAEIYPPDFPHQGGGV